MTEWHILADPKKFVLKYQCGEEADSCDLQTMTKLLKAFFSRKRSYHPFSNLPRIA